MKKTLYILAFALIAAGCQPGVSDYSVQNDAKSVPLSVTINDPAQSQTDPLTPGSSLIAEDGGISGTTMIGPTCPDPMTSKMQSCVAQPLSATVQFQNAETNVMVTKVTSDKDGKFKVTLPAGTYLVIPVRTNTYPKAETQKVVVQRGGYTEVNIVFEKGTR